ncbi:hypothetical protein D3C71_1174950 [compost metagenome]
MRDIERGNAGLGLQFDKEVEDLPRGDHIERRGRLVENDAFRIAGKRRSDDDTLLFAAGNLMRHAVHHLCRRLQSYMGQPLLAFLPRLLAGQAAVADQNFRKLRAERQRRVERGARILKHHADATATNGLHLPLGFFQQIVTAEQDLPARFASILWQIAHDRPCERGLA